MKKVEICRKIKQSSGYLASIPQPFPVKGIFNIDQSILNKATKAERLVGKLDGITQTLPDIEFFLKMFAYKDATSSSQIEGTKATMADALEASAGIETGQSDASDIVFYIKALNYGLERIKKFPLSLRLIRELHKKLMAGARATQFCDPGEFRTSQNWIGGLNIRDAAYIPPPAQEMNKALDDFEKFLHDDDSTLPLIHIAYAHAQFETIHPFLDGNGRTGRLLITFLLNKKELTENPVVFLSSFFKTHKKMYYDKLMAYHDGHIFEWLDFFLDGMVQTAEDGILISKKIRSIRDHDMESVQMLAKRESKSSMQVLRLLFTDPIVNSKSIMDATGFTRPGAQKVIDRFIDLGILELYKDEKNYDRKYIYRKYYDAFIN
ncbi:Fic family protein [Patescibacteria group bacterium]|nr:Fic family protein [Patescibacteria group bacterium]MBU1673830.1 Fic family protein [Patescibacteria group bacterium]MBU1963613.1 Fic family protein [Patescibacteria group bacterium]